MRPPCVIGAVAVAFGFAAGCGGSNAEVDAIKHTYETYIEAVKQGDGRTACDLLTPAYRRQASRLVAPPLLAKLKGASCPRVINEGTLPQLQQYEPRLEQIQVHGKRASGFNPAEGPLGQQEVFFRRFGGEWKISNSIFAR
jgi:hypothetical protein